jgi:hypothetical protein
MLHAVSSGTPSTASGAPQLLDDGTGEYDSSWRQLHDFRVPEGTSSSSSSDFVPEVAPAPPPEAHTFFNDALKEKLKLVGELGLVAGDSVALTIIVEKLIKNQQKNNTHAAYVSAFFPPSPADF